MSSLTTPKSSNANLSDIVAVTLALLGLCIGVYGAINFSRNVRSDAAKQRATLTEKIQKEHPFRQSTASNGAKVFTFETKSFSAEDASVVCGFRGVAVIKDNVVLCNLNW